MSKLNTYKEYGDLATYTINERHQVDMRKYAVIQENAIARLYGLNENDFQSIIITMFTKQSNTIKLNKRLSKLVALALIPAMLNNRRGNSITNDAKRAISEAFDKLVYYTGKEISSSPEALGYHEDDKSYYERHTIHAWVNAELNYIEELNKIQIDNECEPNLSLLKDRWNPDMCLKLLDTKEKEGGKNATF